MTSRSSEVNFTKNYTLLYLSFTFIGDDESDDDDDWSQLSGTIDVYAMPASFVNLQLRSNKSTFSGDESGKSQQPTVDQKQLCHH